MHEVTAADGTSFTVNNDHPVRCLQWATIELVHDKREGDVYRALDGDKIAGELRFIRDFPKPGTITIRTIGVVPEYQRRGVAGTLLERLGADNPDWNIDPGTITAAGQAFAHYVLATEPRAREKLYPYYEEKTTGY